MRHLLAAPMAHLATLVGWAVALQACLPGSAGAADAVSDPEADPPPGQAPTQVVITARRRPEGLMQVPGSVSALDASDLEARQFTQLSDLSRAVPGLDINRFGVANPSHAAIFLRGVGVQDHIITTDPAVGLYVDGVYIGRQMGANLRLAQVDRVEVMRGPQGTLYGRNSLGGAVHVITRAPGERPQRQVEFRLGSRGRLESRVLVDQRLDERWSWQAGALLTHRNGVGHALKVNAPHEVGEENEAAARASLRWRLKPDLELTWTADAARGVNGKSPSTIEIFDPAGYFPSQLGLSTAMLPANADDSNSGQAGLFRQTHRSGGLSVSARWNLGPHWGARLIASTREQRYSGGLDDDHTVEDWVSFPERGQARQSSLEVQLNGKHGAVDLVAGVHLGREVGWTNSGPWVYIGPGGHFDIRQTARHAAVYSHARWALDPRWTLAAGLRLSHESKHARAQFDSWADPAAVERDGNWSATTGELSASRTLAPGLLAYATVATGFQSGGFPARPFGGPDSFTAFRPTHALNLEAGLKGRLAARLDGSLSLFHTRYRDLPLQVSVPSGAGFNTVTDNAGTAVAAGVELEATWKPAPGFSLTAAAALTDARITAVPANASSVEVGDRLPLTARHSLSLAPRQVWQLASGAWLDASLDLSWRGPVWGQLANSAANRMAGRSLVNLNLAYTPVSGGWTLALYGRNLGDEVYDVARLDSAFAGFTDVIRNNDRREVGLRLGLGI